MADPTTASVQQALPLGLHLLEDALAETTKSEVSFLESAARDLVGAGGKRLRPRLVFVSYLAAGGDPFPPGVVDAACAVELFHTASLIHDDILDDADTRRGKATVHRQLGIGRAILVGDFVFGRAVSALQRLPQDVQNSIVQAGVDLAEGEALELELTRKGES